MLFTSVHVLKLFTVFGHEWQEEYGLQLALVSKANSFKSCQLSHSGEMNCTTSLRSYSLSFPRVAGTVFLCFSFHLIQSCSLFLIRGDEWSVRAFASMPSTAIFCEHEQVSTRLNFASKSSKGKILRAVKNFNGPFITPFKLLSALFCFLSQAEMILIFLPILGWRYSCELFFCLTYSLRQFENFCLRMYWGISYKCLVSRSVFAV